MQVVVRVHDACFTSGTFPAECWQFNAHAWLNQEPFHAHVSNAWNTHGLSCRNANDTHIAFSAEGSVLLNMAIFSVHSLSKG